MIRNRHIDAEIIISGYTLLSRSPSLVSVPFNVFYDVDSFKVLPIPRSRKPEVVGVSDEELSR